MLNTISLNQQYNLSFYEDIFKNFKCLNCNGDFDEIETFTINQVGRIEYFRNTELLFFFKNLKQDYLSKLKRIEFKHQECKYSLQLLINNSTIQAIKSYISFYKDKRYVVLISSSTKDNLVINKFNFKNRSEDNNFIISDYFFNKEQAIKYLDNLIFT